MTGTKMSPNFRRLVKGASDGEIIIPALRAALFNPTFDTFSIDLPDFKPRKPDGWFHPSTHPLWEERLLYFYLTDPGQLAVEPMDPHSVMAITQGHFWHAFVEKVGIDAGVLVQPDPCPCGCGKNEWYFHDDVLGSRGHTDGVTATAVDDIPAIFEFKTMRPTKVRKIPRGKPSDPEVLQAYKALVPEYFGQGQEYMRISGFRSHRTLILSMEYPFEMREIAMPYDQHYAEEIAAKYRRVRQAVADRRPPIMCCVDQKACPARLLCAGMR